MNAIRIHAQFDSSMLALPEVQPFLGKQVEMVICEQSSPNLATEQDWDNFFASADGDLIDAELVKAYREFNRSHYVAPQL